MSTVIFPPTVKDFDVQEFLTSGTWSIPAGWTTAYVEVDLVGAGGSGGRGGAAAAGAGSGEHVRGRALLSANETVTIGAGGAAQTVNDTAGNDGADTTFGSKFAARGGKGGQTGAGSGGRGGGKNVSVGTIQETNDYGNADAAYGADGGQGVVTDPDRNGKTRPGFFNGGGGAGAFGGGAGGKHGAGTNGHNTGASTAAAANSGAGSGGCLNGNNSGAGGSGRMLVRAWKVT